MKRPKIVRAFLTALIVIIFTVSATSSSATSVDQPWEVQFLKNTVDSSVKNVSTAFGGGSQIPLVSWNIDDSIFYAIYGNGKYLFGNCGPEFSWKCYDISALYPDVISAGTVSQMSTQHLTSTFFVGWVYKTSNGKLQGVQYKFFDSGEYITSNWTDLIELSKFGGVLVGTPSLQLINSDYHIAVTIRSSGDFPTYKLVYLYKSGVNNTSCISAGSLYQCDVIEESVSPQMIDAPSLGISADGSVGIAYFKGNAIKFAYPHTNSIIWPSNCGPGTPKTWRCISIKTESATGILGRNPKLAIGATASKAGIAYTYDDTMIENTLSHANYVGSGGNCGGDTPMMGDTVFKWNCSEVDLFTYLPSPSYSIAIDPDGYSVIAYNNALSDFSPISLYIAYPKARVGNTDPGWIREKIDGAPTTTIQTGAQASLSLNNRGLGLIAHLQEEDYIDDPALKFAQQFEKVYLPLVIRQGYSEPRLDGILVEIPSKLIQVVLSRN